MDIALDGANHNHAERDGGPALGYDGRLHVFCYPLCGFARHHQLGQENLTRLELAADLGQGRDHDFGDHFERIEVRLEGLQGDFFRGIGLTLLEGLRQTFVDRFRNTHFLAP